MGREVSIKEIVEHGFGVWNKFVKSWKRDGCDIDYSLRIDDLPYKPGFFEQDIRILGSCVEELVLNAFKMGFGVAELAQIERQEFGREITETLKIEVYLSIVGDDYLVRVSDNGPGIAEEHKELIWKHLFSLAGTTGLGLPSLKRKLEDYSGRVELESELGKGASFSMYIPIGE